MSKLTRINLLLIAVTLLLLTLWGCKKPNDLDTKVDNYGIAKQCATDNMEAQREFNNIFDIATNTSGNTNFGKNSIDTTNLPACAVVTFEPTDKIITITFSENGCTFSDGTVRKGKVIITGVGNWGEVGSKVYVTLQNYQVKYYNTWHPVSGVKKITITAPNTYAVEVGGTLTNNVISGYATIGYAEGNATWKTSYTINRTAGSDTPWYILDDEYSTNGTAEGTDRNSKPYTVVTEKPIITSWKKCKYLTWGTPISGKFTLTSESTYTASLDYDPDGTMLCDFNCQVTINNKVYNIIVF